MAHLTQNLNQAKLSNNQLNMQITHQVSLPHSRGGEKNFSFAEGSYGPVFNPSVLNQTSTIQTHEKPHLLSYDASIKALNVFLVITGFIMLFFIGLLAY